MNKRDLASQRGLSWEKLDGTLDAKNPEDFIRQLRELFSCQRARDKSGVVYAWVTRSSIPRLRGRSNIIYFGRTTQTLYARYRRYASMIGNSDNWPRYKHIIKHFGPIRVYFAATSDPAKKESRLLQEYYRDHCEYPPVNRASE